MNQNRQADALKAWEDLTIADNFIFQKVMRKKRLCKRLIENILNIKIRRITFPETEKDIRVRRSTTSKCRRQTTPRRTSCRSVRAIIRP